MVNTLDGKIAAAAIEVKKATNPIELEDAQTKLDNLLDIKLARMPQPPQSANPHKPQPYNPGRPHTTKEVTHGD